VKALREIGLWKALKFGCLTMLMALFKVMALPQLRAPFLRVLGARVLSGTIIHGVSFFNSYRRGFSGLRIGRDCFIGDECLLDLADELHMADQVTLAERVTVLTHTNVGYKDHPLQRWFPPTTRPVVFETGSFVGSGAIILPGVRIGTCSFVAAGSVVTEDVPAFSLVGGVPARVIRKLENNGRADCSESRGANGRG